MQTWGVGTFIIGLLMVLAGLTGWPSAVERGMAAPGVYEQKRIMLKERPISYDNWTMQLQRQKERGR